MPRRLASIVRPSAGMTGSMPARCMLLSTAALCTTMPMPPHAPHWTEVAARPAAQQQDLDRAAFAADDRALLHCLCQDASWHAALQES